MDTCVRSVKATLYKALNQQNLMQNVIIVNNIADIDDSDIYVAKDVQSLATHWRQETAHYDWLTT